MVCIDIPYYNLGGRAIKITVITSSPELCEKVKQVIMRMRDFRDLINGLGGCTVESEQPLKIVSGDRSLEIVVEPGSLFSKMYWVDVAKRVRDTLCGGI